MTAKRIARNKRNYIYAIYRKGAINVPRLAKSQRDKFMTNIAANIKYHQTMLGTPSRDLAKVSGIALSTYYKRMRNPENITLGELYNLAQFIQIPVKDLISGKE